MRRGPRLARAADHRPPWWPADQPWPPQRGAGWHGRGRHVARRAGCAIAVFMLVLGGMGTALVWLVLSATGVVGSAPFARVVSGAGLLFGVLAVVLAVVWLRRLAVPAGRLVEAARRIEGGDYSARVPVHGPSELRSVARAFNAMSGRLEADEVRRRSVLADVAHELRTPLTIIRGQAEGVADGLYPPEPEQMAPILAATRALEALVADLRIAALADAGSLHLERQAVDVGVLVNETLDAFRPSAAAAGIRLEAELGADVGAIEGDAARLSGVVANLVANALRHSGSGGTVRVSGSTEDGHVRLTVRDDGEGIAPELLPRIFDRFVKGPASTGSGLGLAIVRDVVEAHGGSVAADSVVGKGTAIHVTLPVDGATGEPAPPAQSA